VISCCEIYFDIVGFYENPLLAIQYLNTIITYISLKYFILSIRSLIFYNTVVIKVVLGVEINYKEKIEYIL